MNQPQISRAGQFAVYRVRRHGTRPMYFAWQFPIIAGAVRISEFMTRSLAERVAIRLERNDNQEYKRRDESSE